MIRFAALTSAVVFVGSGGIAHAQPSPAMQVTSIAENSECAAFRWGYAADLPNADNQDARRGAAPKAYMRGIALVFARAVCQPDRADVKVVSEPRGKQGSIAVRKDALTWYDSTFQAGGMSNATAGADTLRHAYALLISLGMQESSGKYCTGRDTSQEFDDADSAEAGLLQTSWGARVSSSVLTPMFNRYQANQNACLLDVFSQNVTCTPEDEINWGTGDGADWQKLTKACPAFAVEYGAVVMRKSGGETGEFNPIRKRWVEVVPACNAMLAKIQTLLRENPSFCGSLP